MGLPRSRSSKRTWNSAPTITEGIKYNPAGQGTKAQPDRRVFATYGRLELNTPEKDSRDWRAYKQHRILLIGLILAWIPVVRIAGVLQDYLHLPIFVEQAVTILWFFMIVIAGSRFALWPCPSCGKSFRGFSPFLPKRCWHCHIPR
jgi:hypothetical protein